MYICVCELKGIAVRLDNNIGERISPFGQHCMSTRVINTYILYGALCTITAIAKNDFLFAILFGVFFELMKKSSLHAALKKHYYFAV